MEDQDILVFRSSWFRRLLYGFVMFFVSVLFFVQIVSSYQDVSGAGGMLWAAELILYTLLAFFSSAMTVGYLIGQEKAILHDHELTVTPLLWKTPGPISLRAGGTLREGFTVIGFNSSMITVSLEVNGRHVQLSPLWCGQLLLKDVVGEIISKRNMNALV